MHVLYAIASWFALAAALPFLLLRRKTRGGLAERFGSVRGLPKHDAARPRIWLHGASAGDLLALLPMVAPLRQRFPNARIVASTFTNTGYAIGLKHLGGALDAIFYAPFDVGLAVRRTLAAVKPDLLVLEYTEIWPNLIREAGLAGARVVLTNGRFGPRHLDRYRVFFWLIGNPLLRLDALLMREEDEAARAVGLGARPAQVHVTGNTKFDALAPDTFQVSPSALKTALGIPSNAPVLVAGSTHDGEEDAILEVYSGLLAEFPALRLLLAPRYTDRAVELLGLCQSRGLPARLRSQCPLRDEQVLVLDTMGELAHLYAVADLVFVGGSFTERGGQNILEPAAHGKPVLFGPHMENYNDCVQVLLGRGGIQVADREQLLRVLLELLRRQDEREELGRLAQATVRNISGASARNVAYMASLLAPLDDAPPTSETTSLKARAALP